MIKLQSKKNKIAVVTGSARRLGRDIAISLAKSGFDIALHYNNSSKNSVNEAVLSIETQGARAFPFKADISKVEQIKFLFEKIKKEYKTIDVLVNNAAIFRAVDLFKINEKIFDEFINTNLKSVLFCSIEASKIMLGSKNKSGKIINIASLGGIQNWKDFIPYSISKVGVIKLTKLLAKRLAPGILVNAIAPGTVLIENDANETADLKEVVKYPMKRFANPNDITSFVNYLADTNEYITGQIFIIDGGISI